MSELESNVYNGNRFAGMLDDDIRIEKNINGTESYIFDPYNPLNKAITKDDVEEILRNYGITAPVMNFELYKRAFVHRSYIKRPNLENTNNNIIIVPKPSDCLPLYTKSNERLEFIGDGILECITKYYLYRRFPKEKEGFMTEKKIALVKNESIGKMALEMGLHRWVIISKHSEATHTRCNLKKLGCLFESFVGALFLDFNKITVTDEHGWFKDIFATGPGFQMAQVFIEKIFEKHVNWIDLIRNDDNYKNILQVKIQKEFKTTPTYLEMEPYNQTTGYKMGVYLCLGQSVYMTNIADAIPIDQLESFADIHSHMSNHGKIFVFLGEGLHKTKKVAEQQACYMSLSTISGFSS
jgi:dsRNA-specific ribonuclease